MKKLLFAMSVGLFSLSVCSQEKLMLVFETNFTSKWDKSFGEWGEFDQTHAIFQVYKDERSGATTKIVAFMDSSNDYSIGTTFFVYNQIYKNESMGQSLYYYVNEGHVPISNRKFDKSIYIKITDEMDGQVSIIELSGYKPEKINWTVRNIIKK